ncbi:hypothetical protein V1281_004602 [Nitrobacteraceae bacterium AZCC 2161]
MSPIFRKFIPDLESSAGPIGLVNNTIKSQLVCNSAGRWSEETHAS